MAGVNVQDCSGGECGKVVCQNGASCSKQADLSNQTCICSEVGDVMKWEFYKSVYSNCRRCSLTKISSLLVFF